MKNHTHQTELNKEEDKPCHHPYLKTKKKTADKVCTSCGRVIYSGQNNLRNQLSLAEKSG